MADAADRAGANRLMQRREGFQFRELEIDGIRPGGRARRERARGAAIGTERLLGENRQAAIDGGRRRVFKLDWR